MRDLFRLGKTEWRRGIYLYGNLNKLSFAFGK